MTLTLRYAARSDRGLIRDGNQDSVYAGPRLLAVDLSRQLGGVAGVTGFDVALLVSQPVWSSLQEGLPRVLRGRPELLC